MTKSGTPRGKTPEPEPEPQAPQPKRGRGRPRKPDGELKRPRSTTPKRKPGDPPKPGRDVAGFFAPGNKLGQGRSPGPLAPPPKGVMPTTIEEAAAVGAPAEVIWKFYGVVEPTDDQKREYDRGRARYELGIYADLAAMRSVRAQVLLACAEQLPWWKDRESHTENDEDVRERLRGLLHTAATKGGKGGGEK